MSERWSNLWDLFHQARELEGEAREAFLDEECGDDSELAAELRSLLGAHDQSGEFLETPADGGRGDDPLIGAQVGPYRLLEVIGEGGMGTVYRAEQAGEVEREVAFKVIKLGMDTRQVVGRFEAERQVLARMTHPGIATVLDAGMTDDGRPYFVMEMVEGEPITRFCDQHRLDTEERLHLFASVCEAVQHAHQKGVIHRDLKPSNILVTGARDRPRPKVIDFGIAKAIDREESARTAFTRMGQIIGTPEYMSPEQSDGSDLDVDTRSDIYSLGVLLYEVLVGALPFDAETLRRAGYAEIQRIIREQDPPTPSARFRGLTGELGEQAAASRQTHPGGMLRALRGELDWIVMKAMEKDRARRYATAQALAADLERHLADEPVSAGPPTPAYRISKFIRRNRIAVGVGVVIAGLLLGFAIVVSIQSARLREALAEAEDRSAEAEAVNRFIVGLFRLADPFQTVDELSTRELLERGAQRLAGDELADQPSRKASLLIGLSPVYTNLNLREQALAMSREAVDLAVAAHGERHRQVGQARYTVASVLEKMGQVEEAAALVDQALELQREIDVPATDLVKSLGLRGFIDRRAGRFDDAEHRLVEAVALARTLKPNPDHAEDLFSGTLADLAVVQMRKGELEAAEATAREALKVMRERGPGGIGESRRLDTLALIVLRQGRHQEAVDLYRRSLAILTERLGRDSVDVAMTLSNLGATLYEKGAYDEAEQILNEALELVQARLSERNPEVGRTMMNLALALQEQRKFERSEAMFRQVLFLYRSVYGEKNWQVAYPLNNLGWLLYNKGDYAEAEPYYLEANQILSGAYGAEHPVLGFSLNNLGLVHHALDDLDQAEAYFRKALELRRKGLPEGHAQTASSLVALADLMVDRGAAESAETLAREALTIREKQLEPGDWRVEQSRAVLGASLAAQGRFEDAEPLLLNAHSALVQSKGEEDLRTRRVRRHLAALYRDWGKPEERAVWE